MKKYCAIAAVLSVMALAGSASAVVINEFMYTTDGGNYFIELFNRSGAPYDLSDHKVWASEAGADRWITTPVHTVPAGTVLPTGGFYLIVTQDLFMAVPDAEEVFALADPQDSGHVEGIRLTNNTSITPMDPGTVLDTVLYGPNGTTASAGEMLTDQGAIAPGSEVLNTAAVPVVGFGNINISAVVGAGARRWDEALGFGSDGNGQDTNNSFDDFAGYGPGGASPRSMTTPVTLSLFEIE